MSTETFWAGRGRYAPIPEQAMEEKAMYTPEKIEEMRQALHAALPPNPKQAYGDKKLPLHRVPPAAVAYAAMGLKDGAVKYGPFNWRNDPVELLTYYAACQRHMMAWFDGEEIDADSGNPHMAHAIACLAIMIDAVTVGNAIDNRPKPSPYRMPVAS